MPQLLMPLDQCAHMQVNIPHICVLVRRTNLIIKTTRYPCATINIPSKQFSTKK